MVAGVGLEPHDLRVIPAGLLRCPKPFCAAYAADGFDRCANPCFAASAPGGARRRCPTSCARRSHTPIFSVKEKQPSDLTAVLSGCGGGT